MKEMITYFQDKNHKSKKRCDIYFTLTSILESVDTVVITGATTTSVTLLVIGVELILMSSSAGVASVLSLGDKVKLHINIY